MLKVIDQQGIQNIIQYITTIQPILNKTKTELENYINFLKQGNYDLSSNGTVDDQIKRCLTVLDKYDEIVNRRKVISEEAKKMKSNIESMKKNVDEMLTFTGEEEQIHEIHDELIDNIIKLKKEKFDIEVEELENQKKNPFSEEELQKLQEWTSM